MAECPVVATTRPAVHEGAVYVIDKEDKGADVKWYMKVFCIGVDGQPARLEAFQNSKHASKGYPVLRAIKFSEVTSISPSDINKRDKKIIVIVVSSGNDFLFYVNSQDDHAKWLGYCKMLFTLPQYIIPEIPKWNLVSKKCASKFTDPRKFDATHVFVVYLINEGVASVLNLSGLHIIAISETTFNICTYHTEKLLITWDQDKIRRSGCIESLVFIEPGRKCHGGPGLLWMYYSYPSKFMECLQYFLHVTPFTSKESVYVDPNVNTTYITSSDSCQLLKNTQTDQNVPPTSQGWYLPSTSKPKVIPTSCLLTGKQGQGQSMQMSHLAPSCEISSRNNWSAEKKEEFRPRCRLVSKSELKISESYSKLRSKRRRNDATQIAKQLNVAESLEQQEPPPLPPKPSKYSHKLPPQINDVLDSSKSSSTTSEHLLTNCELPPKNGTHSQNCKCCSQRSLEDSLEERVLNDCVKSLVKKLDVRAIQEHLIASNLLSRRDRQFLNNTSHDDDTKVYYLLNILPRKSNGWLKVFIQCLHDSEEGTGHKEVAETIEAKLKEVGHGDNEMTPTLPIPASSDTEAPIQVTSDTDECSQPYPVFIDLPSAVDTIQVLPLDSVKSLLAKVREKFNISSTEAVKLEMKDSQLHCGKSVRESRIYRYSYIFVRLL